MALKIRIQRKMPMDAKNNTALIKATCGPLSTLAHKKKILAEKLTFREHLYRANIRICIRISIGHRLSAPTMRIIESMATHLEIYLRRQHHG